MTRKVLFSWACIVCGRSVATAAETFHGQTYFFGDLHAHTGVSPDGCASDGGLEDTGVQDHWESVSSDCPGSPPPCLSMDAVFDTAVANGLDFVALTDHHDSNEEDFDWLLQLALERRDILVIPSVEIRHQNLTHLYGHKNMYVFRDGPLDGLTLAAFAANRAVRPDHCQEDIWTNVALIDAMYGPALLWSHHVSASAVQTTDWSCHDEDWEPVVEIYDGWGNALTYDASFDPVEDPTPDKTAADWDAVDATVHEALDMGYRLGFVGGTDEHDTRPGVVCDAGVVTGAHKYAGGLTVVALDGADAVLTRAAIYDELVGRHTLVTSGPQVPVQVTWTVNGVRHEFGDVIDVGTRGSSVAKVRIPPAYAGMVMSVRAVGYTTSYPLLQSATLSGTWGVAIPNVAIPSWLYVEVEIDGAVYYAKGCNDGGYGEPYQNDEYVWSSPTWFE